MKPKVKNWLDQLNKGIIKTNTTKIIYEIHKHTFRGKGYITIDELRRDLNMAHQTLTAIVSSIQDEGIIKSIGEIDINDRPFSKLAYAEKSERNHLILKRRKEKLSQWIKRGKEEWLDLMPQSLIDEINKL